MSTSKRFCAKYTNLDNNNVAGDSLASRTSALDRNRTTVIVFYTILDELFPTLCGAACSCPVVLRMEDNTSLRVVQVGLNVCPRLVVVYPQRHEERFAVGKDTESARGPAPANRQDVRAVRFCPSSAVGVAPNCLLSHGEIGVGIGLVNTSRNLIGHANEESIGGEL